VSEDQQQIRSATTVAVTSAAVMIAQQVGGKATRDALFLDAFSSAQLPKVMLASAVLSMAAVLLMTGSMSRFGPARVVPGLFTVSGLAYLGEWALLARSPRLAAGIVYLHVAVLGSLLVSGFWSVITERFDPHTAKTVVGRIAAGGTTGGLIGGLLAERVASWLDSRSMLLFLGGMSVACAAGVLKVGGPRDRITRPVSAADGIRHLRQSRYLLMLGTLVGLTALTAGVIDYAFKAQAEQFYSGREDLMRFFAVFYAVSGVATVALQTLFAQRSLSVLGIGTTIAILPGAVVLTGVLGASWTILPTVVMVIAVENVLYNSLYRSGYELLFTPVVPEKKRPTKTVIDVGFRRIGGAIASGLVMLVLALAPGLSIRISIIIAVVIGSVTVLVTRSLHRGYVNELATSLRSGRLELDEQDIVDATTRRTLSETTMAIDREKLLQEIEQLRRKEAIEKGDNVDLAPDSLRTPPVAPIEPVAVQPEASHPLFERAADLMSGDTQRVRRALRAPLEPSVIGLVLPLLGSDLHARAARRALRQAAPRVTGQLVDALLDRQLDEAVRRRVADVLKTCRTERSAAGLSTALEEEPFEVRRRAALALRDLATRNPAFRAAPDRLFAAVDNELDVEDGEVDLDHVFILLGMALDNAEPLKLALRALRSDDRALRGTSLEYLENVLPDSTRHALWPHVEAPASASLSRRRIKRPIDPDRQLAEELKRSMDSLKIDPEALRKVRSN
jgi:hypothetical protein